PPPDRRLDRHRASERFSEKHDPLRRESPRRRGLPDRLAVRVQPILVGPPGAPPVAPIVHEDHVEPQLLDEDPGPLEPMAGVAGVAVKVEERAPPVSADPPSGEPRPSLRFERKLLGGKSQVARKGVVLPRGEVDEPGLERAKQQRQASGGEQSREEPADPTSHDAGAPPPSMIEKAVQRRRRRVKPCPCRRFRPTTTPTSF